MLPAVLLVMVRRKFFVSTLMVTAVVTAGCMPALSNTTAPSPVVAACAAAPGPIDFLGWTTANLPPGSVTLTWNAAPGIVSVYVVELGTTRGATNVGTVVVGGSARSHTYDGLAAGDYFGRVRARNDCGTSAPSNEANPRVR